MMYEVKDEPRAYTNVLVSLIENGHIDKEDVIRNLLNWLSEDEMKEFCIQYDYVIVDDDQRSYGRTW